MEKNGITEYFEEVETTREYDGYYYSVSEAITIVILGSICGLKNTSQIHQWAENERVREFLREKFGIGRIPCYYWLLCLMKLVKTETLNRCFMNWAYSFMPERVDSLTIALDGKTVCSTAKMDRYESPLHIVSAQLSELGITLAQRSVDGKSNEIPAVQELLDELNIRGSMVTADALNCQKETAHAIIKGKADYLLCVKDNHPNLKRDIGDFVQDAVLRQSMGTATTAEKNRGRIERRTGYVTTDTGWLEQGEEWENLCCIGAIHSEIETKKGKTSEWRYYISSRKLSPEELLRHARMEWAVESMHWLLDVHFEEDWCRVEDKNVQQNLNMLRKAAINLIKVFKTKSQSKKAISKIMLDCLLEPKMILQVIGQN